MAWGQVNQGVGGTTKAYFTVNGNWITNPSITIPLDSSRVSPDLDEQPCTAESFYIESCGGSMWCFASNGSFGQIRSNTFDAAGTANSSSARYAYSPGASGKLYGGDTIAMGVANVSGGVGFNRTPTGGGITQSPSGTGWTNSEARLGFRYNTIPTAPSALVAEAGAAAGEVKLSWASPISDGGLVINGYTVEWSDDDFATVAGRVDSTESTALNHTVTGLTTDGTEYKFRVGARNAVCDAFDTTEISVASVRSNVVAFTPAGAGVNRWDGDSFEPTPVNGWDGDSMEPVVLQRWDGDSWEPLG
jgi:hypothetical protein